MKSRRIRWVGPIACMVQKTVAYRVLVGKPEGKRPFEDQGVDGSIILKWIYRKWDGGMD